MKNKTKILIVDDEKDILDLYANKFLSSGYEVITTNKGLEVLQLIESKNPDIVLLDIMMEDIDGFQVLKKIKTDSKFKKTVVIILSNMGESEEIQKGVLLGADDYVVKVNYTPAEVVQKVENFLNKDK